MLDEKGADFATMGARLLRDNNVGKGNGSIGGVTVMQSVAPFATELRL